MTSDRPRPVILIELMRFACALAVMACHYTLGFWRMPGARAARLLAGIAWRAPVERWTQFGWLGVELFFVISGLVIMRSVDGETAAGFARRRLLRLLPAAWVCATATLLIVGGVGGVDAGLVASWGRALALWPVGAAIDGSWWTLGIEIAFYGVVALGLATGGGTARVERVATAVGAASLCFWIGCAAAGPAGAALFGSRVAQLLLLQHGCFFALGALIARCQRAGVTPARLLATLLMAGCGLGEVAVHAIESANDTGLPRAILPALLVFAGAAVLLALAPRVQPLLARVIRPETARGIGMMTYPLYLLHQDAGAALTALLVHHGLTPAAALAGVAAVMLALAALVARGAEPMVRRWLAVMLGEVRPRRHAPAPGTRPTASLRAG